MIFSMEHTTHQLDMTAFASGQIGSKLWLCEELEKLISKVQRPTIYTLGGWYGHLAFLILSRGRIQPKMILNIDLDEEALKVSQLVNNLWWFPHPQYLSYRADINRLDYQQPVCGDVDRADIVINTSIEHMPDRDWIRSISTDQLLVLQATDMLHDDHVVNYHSLEQFEEAFPLSKCLFRGQKFFDYGNASSFTRYMLIGHK